MPSRDKCYEKNKVHWVERMAVLHGTVREGISAKVDISQTSEEVKRPVVWLPGGKHPRGGTAIQKPRGHSMPR